METYELAHGWQLKLGVDLDRPGSMRNRPRAAWAPQHGRSGKGAEGDAVRELGDCSVTGANGRDRFKEKVLVPNVKCCQMD